MQTTSPKRFILFATLWTLSLVIAYYAGSRLTTSLSSESSEAQSAAPQATAAQALAQNDDTSAPAENAADENLTTAPSTETLVAEIQAALTTTAATPQAEEHLKSLLVQLAATQPQQALELAEQIKSLRAKETARVAILETWARTDPVAALAWAQTALVNETASVRNVQMRAIYRGYAMENPAAALQLASQLDASTTALRRQKTQFMGEIIETQIQNGDLAGARLAIEQMEDGEIKSSLTREMVNEWASYDPEGAAAYVDSLGPDVDPRIKNSLVDSWAESDPAAAAAWLSTLPAEDPAISRAAASLVRDWARYDLNASAEWLNSLPASPDLDRAVASYTFRAAQEDPATAMTWAESVTDQRIQGYLTQRVAAEWKDNDPEGFQQYLDQSDLSDKDKERLLNSNSWGSGRGPGGGPH